jgi:hypothetical protein
MFLRKSGVAAWLAFAMVLPVQAEQMPLSGKWAYSSLCWDPQGGDAAGYRIRLERKQRADTLSIEWSEGPREGPAKAFDLTIDDQTSKIRFKFMPFAGGSPVYQVMGRLSQHEIVLEQWDWGDGQGFARLHMRLPRVSWENLAIRNCS